MSDERQKEIEKFQEVTTSLMLQLRERDEEIWKIKAEFKM